MRKKRIRIRTTLYNDGELRQKNVFKCSGKELAATCAYVMTNAIRNTDIPGDSLMEAIVRMCEGITHSPWRPQHHARWIMEENSTIADPEGKGKLLFHCSRCGKLEKCGDDMAPDDIKYCWNCGARMDEPKPEGSDD